MSGAPANLKEQFGERFVVRDDGSDDSNRAERVWCMEIPGKFGTIYPCGLNGDLAVWTGSQRIAVRLRALGLKPLQGGPDAEECSFRFPTRQLETVAGIIQAKRRRRLSPEARQQLIERLKAGRSADSEPVSVPEEATSRPQDQFSAPGSTKATLPASNPA